MNAPNIKIPVPENESQRLRAVRSYDVLDTPPEVDFDTLLRVALRALDAPAGVIGLMDEDRLWFKSQIGVGLPEFDRKVAFCAYTIMLPDELLVVEDLRSDPRFSDNPLVVHAPNLRFYAGAPLIDRQGYVLGTIAVVGTQPRQFSDDQRVLLSDLSTLVITALENRQRANQLSHLAMTDYLTGLANRAQFERTIHSEMAHARRTGESFNIFYMDLDDFKEINDTFGHAAGDEVLREVSLRMAGQVRAEDMLARFGGDEFGVFMRPSAEYTAESLEKRILDVISVPITLSSGEIVSVGISIGVAAYTHAIDSVEALLKKADQALYEVKRGK